MSAEAWTIMGTGGALFVGLAGLAIAIWRSLEARLELLAQQHAAALRDLRADHDARFDSINARLDRMDIRLDRLEARQYEMVQALVRLGEPVRDPAAAKPTP